MPETWKEVLRPYYLRLLYFPIAHAKPDYFDKCWQYPWKTITPESVQDFAGNGGASPSFVFLSMSDWHTRIQRPQQLARALARAGHRCYFLNPHLGREYPNLYLADHQPRLATLETRVAEVHVRLPREPVYHARLLRQSETAKLVDTLGAIAAFEKRIVQIVGFPVWGDTAFKLRNRYGWPVIYDCHDLLSGFQNVSQDIIDAEPELIQRSDYALFSSDYLAAKLSARTRPDRTAIVRNALSADWLALVRSREHRKRDTKVVGYFGALQEWFDIVAVERAATANPSYEFRLIGRLENADISRLRAVPNVKFLGEVPHTQLPTYLADMDVGLIPFHVRDLTLATNPIKLYEYFAAGIPVVSSPLPEVMHFQDLVYSAHSADDWGKQVKAAAEENDAVRRQRRRNVAEQETWEARGEVILRLASSLAATHR